MVFYFCLVKYFEILDLIDMLNGIRCLVLVLKLNWKVLSVWVVISRFCVVGYDIEILVFLFIGEIIYCCWRWIVLYFKIEVGL